MKAEAQAQETDRIAALKSFDILDTESEGAFDEFVELAATICEMPMAALGFMDNDRQWLKSATGLGGLREIPRDSGFCAYTLLQSAPLVVKDATEDRRFSEIPLVTGELRVRSYVGVPVVSPSGAAIGSLFVLDRVPRVLSANQLKSLELLARRISGRLGFRMKLRALEDAEDLFHLIVDAAPTAMIMAGQRREIVLVNQVAEALFGYRRDELIGQPIEILVPLRNRELHPKHVTGFQSDPTPRAMGVGRELFGRRKDGTEFPIEIGLNPLKTKDGSFTLAAVVDITLRRQADERQRKADAENQRLTRRFQLAASSGQIGVWDWDVKKDVMGWDETMYTLCGSAATFEDAHQAWRATVHPDDLADFEARIEEALKGTRDFNPRFRVVRSDGTIRHLASAASIERNPSTGEPLRMVGVDWDVTEEEVATAKLRESNAELEQFAYVASHDLQEPLRMVASYTELLSQRYKGQLDAKADKYIFYAADGARRMQLLIRDLLAYSRVTSQGKPLSHVPVDGVLRDVVNFGLGDVIKSVGATLEIGPLPSVLADAGQVGQLFQNLIANALKFRGTAPPHVRIQAEARGDRWLFSVADNGIGIEMQYADRIFQMFQRLHGRDAYDGSGIGLSIAKRIVERHDGRIWFESTPGVGTTFYFTLPGIAR